MTTSHVKQLSPMIANYQSAMTKKIVSNWSVITDFSTQVRNDGFPIMQVN